MLIMLVSGVLVAKLSGLWPETQKVLSRKISQPHAVKKSARIEEAKESFVNC